MRQLPDAALSDEDLEKVVAALENIQDLLFRLGIAGPEDAAAAENRDPGGSAALLDPALLAAFDQNLDEVQRLLPFLVELSPEERRQMHKLTEEEEAFILGVLAVAEANAEILPPEFDLAAFRNKVDLRWKLKKIGAAGQRALALLTHLTEHLGEPDSRH